MARIIDIGIAQKDVPYIVETGLLIVSMPESEAAVHGFLMQTNLNREVLL